MNECGVELDTSFFRKGGTNWAGLELTRPFNKDYTERRVLTFHTP